MGRPSPTRPITATETTTPRGLPQPPIQVCFHPSSFRPSNQGSALWQHALVTVRLEATARRKWWSFCDVPGFRDTDRARGVTEARLGGGAIRRETGRQENRMEW